MKLSEHIAQCQVLLAVRGDIRVLVNDDHAPAAEYSGAIPAEGVTEYINIK